jgi:hypothetical protein
MEQSDKDKIIRSFSVSSDVDVSRLDVYQAVRDFFKERDGWIYEGNACWSTRDKMARLQPDGVGYNFEVWQSDDLPKMTYCHTLAETKTDFIIQATEAGIK